MKTKIQITKELKKKLDEFCFIESEIKRLSQFMGTFTERRKLLSNKTICAGEYNALLWVLNKKTIKNGQR